MLGAIFIALFIFVLALFLFENFNKIDGFYFFFLCTSWFQILFFLWEKSVKNFRARFARYCSVAVQGGAAAPARAASPGGGKIQV